MRIVKASTYFLLVWFLASMALIFIFSVLLVLMEVEDDLPEDYGNVFAIPAVAIAAYKTRERFWRTDK